MLENFDFDPLIQFLKPFGFSDYNNLQMNALCVISDSGTISEESAMLRFPAITIRNSMERPEAIDAGTIVITGFDPEVVMGSIDLVVDEGAQYAKICPEYEVENTAMRVLKLVMGTAKLHKQWSGLY
jgi:UDP-N-acetylglucosamine 2-epimerase (non-hydrolysing)